jgi:hypothetical protein
MTALEFGRGGSYLLKRMIALIASAGMLAGCGGGASTTNKLFTLQPGVTWNYRVTGSVTLSAALGGGSQTLPAGSALVVSVPSGTVLDTASNQQVNILDRKFDLVLLDGRHVQGNMRLYWSQDSKGINCHGFNLSPGTTVDSTKDRFVKATANPPLKFLYLPDPVNDNLSVTYDKPVDPAAAGTSYSFTLGAGLQQVTVPAGSFLAKGLVLSEKFVNTTNGDFVLSNAALVPDKGIVSGFLNATLPDGSALNGAIVLTSYTF